MGCDGYQDAVGATRPGRGRLERGGVDAMPIYVRGRDEKTYHWCRNCPSYPPVYGHATPRRPREMLCPQCDALERGGSCRPIED